MTLLSDQVRKDMKYVLEAEKSLLESTDLISILNIPLNIILPKLTVENLKLVANSHKLRIQSKMKSQELQTIINEHMCENCESYVYISQCIKNENKSDKCKASLLKATKKYQTKNSELYRVTHLESVKKYQIKNPETFKISNLESVKKHQKKMNYIKLHIWN